MRAATVVQVLQPCRTSFKFYCVFYFTCDRFFSCFFPVFHCSISSVPQCPTEPGILYLVRRAPSKCLSHVAWQAQGMWTAVGFRPVRTNPNQSLRTKGDCFVGSKKRVSSWWDFVVSCLYGNWPVVLQTVALVFVRIIVAQLRNGLIFYNNTQDKLYGAVVMTYETLRGYPFRTFAGLSFQILHHKTSEFGLNGPWEWGGADVG